MRWILPFICIVCYCSCSDTKDTPAHDPLREIKINSITPTEAGMGADLLIYGENFSTQPEEIEVLLNGKKAAVIGSTLDMIFAIVPRKPETDGTVQIKIGDKASNEVPFTYITAETTQTLAGNGNKGDADGFSEKAQFNFSDMPGICLSPGGNLIVADCGNHKIKSVSPEGEVKTILTGLNKPTDVVYDKDGNLYIANCDGMAIVKVDVNNQMTNVGLMDWPTAVAYDETTDNIYGVLYAGGNIMKVIDKNETASSGNRNMETFLATSSYNVSFMRFKDGDLYFTSLAKHAIYVLRKGASEPEVVAGVPGQKGITTVATDAKEALLTNPCGLAFAPNGDMYFSSGVTRNTASEDNKIYILTQKDGKVAPFMGKKESGFSDGGATTTLFNSPAALAVDSENSVFVADKLNYSIRKITIQ